MARDIRPVTKKLRRFKLLPESTAETPAQNFAGGRRKSVYGIRLEEKQKLRYIYGILERQFRRYFDEARKTQEDTSLVLMQLLERRLDNVIYRLGFSTTRKGARQFVNHGHVLVNEKKVSIPSMSVKVGDTVRLKDASNEIPQVKKSLEEGKDMVLPSWLKRKGLVGMVQSLPAKDDLISDIDLQLIIEYYSR